MTEKSIIDRFLKDIALDVLAKEINQTSNCFVIAKDGIHVELHDGKITVAFEAIGLPERERDILLRYSFEEIVKTTIAESWRKMRVGKTVQELRAFADLLHQIANSLDKKARSNPVALSG